MWEKKKKNIVDDSSIEKVIEKEKEPTPPRKLRILCDEGKVHAVFRIDKQFAENGIFLANRLDESGVEFTLQVDAKVNNGKFQINPKTVKEELNLIYERVYEYFGLSD